MPFISSIKAAKYRLACLALDEIFGKDNADALFGGVSQKKEYGSKPNEGLPKADASSYVGGLLWNLETYQHGCSADYGFVYGRGSPTPLEVISINSRLVPASPAIYDPLMRALSLAC